MRPFLRTLPLLLAAVLAAQSPAPTPAGEPAQSAPATVPQQPPVAQPTVPAPPATGQPAQPANSNQPPTATIRTSSRLVILDTVVLDKKGNIVTGLTKDDFHVVEEDSPQTILNFTTAGTFTPSPDLTINSTADLDRLAPRAPVNIILLDEFNTRFEDMAFARYSLKKYLQKQPGKLDQPTMLIAVSLQKFEVLHDYTQDKDAILNALDHHLVAFPWQLHSFTWVSERYGQAFTTLLRIAQATQGHPGHKNMIWVGRGFPTIDFTRVALDQQQRVESIVQEVVNQLRDARITLYTIDPAGVQANPYAYGQTAADYEPFGGNYQFNRLAQATGGRTFYGRNDVDAEIGTSLRDGSSFYTLTYRPTGAANNPNRFRRIQVTFDNPNYHAVTREGYYPQRGPARYNPQGTNYRLFNELAAANTGNMVYDGVPITLQADPNDPDRFTVHVDARGLNWTIATETDPRRAEVILLATSFDKKGKVLGDAIARNIKIAAPPTVPPNGRLERAIDFNVTLKHNPQAVRARFVIRVASTGRIGTVDTQLHPNQQATAKPAPAPPTAAGTPNATTPSPTTQP
ncbi:VWA domain-containing protein [Terriglobus sp.]|uniref:VWA domain-containing protein n=1 Tax=Terriglobus sp. TaxID=1889013 RepID=UPI003B00B9BE